MSFDIPEKWNSLFSQHFIEFGFMFYLDLFLDCVVLYGKGHLLSKALQISDEKGNLLQEYIDKWYWKDNPYEVVRSGSYRRFSEKSENPKEAILSLVNELNQYM